MKTEMIFILDRSGSMSGLESDTIGGFNSMIEKQKKLDGEAFVTTVLFDSRIEVVHKHVDLKEVGLLNEDIYNVRGTTALLDAIGISLRKTRHRYADTLIEERPDKVVFLITTDGMENASREFDYSMIKRDIKYAEEKYGFEFIFLGANIDVKKMARRTGLREANVVRYHSDKVGTKLNFNVMNETMTSLRGGQKLEKGWKDKIEKDFSSRS